MTMNALTRKLVSSIARVEPPVWNQSGYPHGKVTERFLSKMPDITISGVQGGGSLLKDIQSRIRIGGPITVADYMKTVLTFPSSGYYMTKDVFGKEGDFTTSPEICQMFGELIAVWCVDQWYKMGRPTPLQIVELGPGRGTMMSDILRTLNKVKDIEKTLSVHLVEISPTMKALQQKNLCGHENLGNVSSDEHAPDSLRSSQGFPVYWHQVLSDVPKEFSIFLAHEFFDALPIHKFQKTKNGWREVLIDVGAEISDEKLRFVLSRNKTPASAVFIKADETREHVEVSPQGQLVVGELADRVVEDGGVALIVDYGHTGDKTDTFRAFRRHSQVDPLDEPGSSDLTADVNFADLQRVLDQNNDVLTIGPVPQATFLENMGIKVRLEQLLTSCSESSAESLKSSYAQLMDSDKMGTLFKFFAIYPETTKLVFDQFPPSGFYPSQ